MNYRRARCGAATNRDGETCQNYKDACPHHASKSGRAASPPPSPTHDASLDHQPQGLSCLATTTQKVALSLGLSAAGVEREHHAVAFALKVIHPLTPLVPDEPEAVVVFKGGTALAAISVIQRLSRDLDIAIVPLLDNYGGNRRRRWLREMLTRTEPLCLGVPQPNRYGTRFRRATLPYPSTTETTMTEAHVLRYVDVEITVSRGLGLNTEQDVSSLLSRHLSPEEAAAGQGRLLVAHPLETMVEKLHAQARMSLRETPDRAATRVRDIYDIAMILRTYGDQLEPGQIADWYDTINTEDFQIQTGRSIARPVDGPGPSRLLRPTPVTAPRCTRRTTRDSCRCCTGRPLLTTNAWTSYERTLICSDSSTCGG